MVSRLYIFIILIAASIQTFSQNNIRPAIAWQKCLGGSGFETCKDILVTGNTSIIVVGSTASNNGDVSGYHGNTDAWMVKLDSAGNIQWQLPVGGAGEDVFNAVLSTTDHNYLCIGYTNSVDGDLASVNTGGKRGWAIKLSQAGDILWNKVYDSIDNGISLSDSGFVLFGSKSIMKIDSAGNIIWVRTASYAPGAAVVVESYHQVITTAGDAFDITTGDSTNLGWKFNGAVSNIKNYGSSIFATVTHDTATDGCIINGDFEIGPGTNHINDIARKDSNDSIFSYMPWHINYCYAYVQRYGDGATTPAASNGLAILPDSSCVVAGYYSNYYFSYVEVPVFSLNGTNYYYGSDYDRFYAVDVFPGKNEYICAGSAVANTNDISGFHGGGDIWIVKLARQTATWTGASDTAWENRLNWSGNVLPDKETIVLIPALTPNSPVVNSYAACYSLQLDPNATLVINTGYNLIVSGK